MAISQLTVLELLVILSISFTGTASCSKICTSGFPERARLVSELTNQTGPITRLIPEMKFVCSGTVVGYTVAMRRLSGELHPVIQVWRRNDSECQPANVYYKAETDIEITDNLCVHGLVEVANNSNVFHCDLINTARVSIQPGDILGLKLPPGNNDASVLAFAHVGRKGQTSYSFEEQLLPVVMLSDGTSVVNELPQINVDTKSAIGSTSECTSGFPGRDILASELLDRDGHSNTTVTVLIPDMNFTCNGTLAGFTVAGINRHDGEQDPKIQIWRENISEPGAYHKIGPAIAIDIFHTNTCADRLTKIPKYTRTYLCILNVGYQVSIQPGDILGLQLPPSHDNDFDVLFTKGQGPVNYIFHRPMDSTIQLQLSERELEVQQLPQISLSLTSDKCTHGFPNDVSSNGSGRRDSTKVTTWLFPNLTFGCTGTIVRMIVAVMNLSAGGQEFPRIQIWRENKFQTGIYRRQDSDIPIVNDESVCFRARLNANKTIFRCTLSEDVQVSVQPGDFLGLELPKNSDIYFESGGPLNYVFEGQLNFTVNFSEAHRHSNHLPQLNLVVILENRDGQDESFAPPSCETRTSPPALTTTKLKSKLDGSSQSILGSIIGCTIVASALVFLISLAAAVYKCHKKKQRSPLNYASDGATKDNIDSFEPSRELTVAASLPYVCDPTELHDYEKIPELRSSRTEQEQAVKLPELDSSCHPKVPQPYLEVEDHAYVIPTIDHYYSQENGDCMAIKESSKEEDIYWEPAKSVNELYKQLCSNKYREIAREEVEIGMKLGSGQFGVVSRGVWESPKGAMDVAVKQLQPGASEEEKVKFLQEAAINGQFRHPNLVMLMGVVTVGEPVMIVLELLSNGDLRTFLVKCRPRKNRCALMEIDEQLLLKFCQHVASGMSYLASKSFVHRDLAARNILVSQDKICKISDFGMSRNLVDENYVSHGGIVPLKWMSPEAINYNKYSTASDVWSFGCVMYEIWSLGHRPFADLSNDEVLSAIEKGYRLSPPPGMSKELYKIMIQCWQPESSHRPTFPQLVELLSRADFELFAWEEEDLRNSDPLQVKTIGAPLETAKNLYPDLQRSYIKNN